MGMGQAQPAAAGAPSGSPMTTPQEPKGQQQAARVQVMMAMDLLAKSIPELGPSSEDGAAVLKALGSLSKAFGKVQDKTREMIPAEILQMLSSLPQAGGSSPGAKQMAQVPPQGMGMPTQM